MKFKVSDRARIQSLVSAHTGLQCTLILYRHTRRTDGRSGLAWETEVDGVGRIGPRGLPLVFLEDELEPLTPDWASEKVKQVTRPVYTEPERVKEREFTLDEINKAVRKHLGRL